jgi:hypothetical protein
VFIYFWKNRKGKGREGVGEWRKIKEALIIERMEIN